MVNGMVMRLWCRLLHTRVTARELPDRLGQRISINGWICNTGRRVSDKLQFLRLRDSVGESLQLVCQPTSKSMRSVLGALTVESVVGIEGVVCSRPQSNRRGNVDDYEVQVEHIYILNTADDPLPFLPSDDLSHIKTQVKAENRHLELRGGKLNQAIRTRAKVMQLCRRIMSDDEGFVEVETPLLFKSTAEGAREFIVPTRRRGEFYALPQSPQQYKQILMASGIDRYFQIAKCFRDEDLRADRQPEFTQLDLEMAFADQENVLAVVEKLICAVWLDIKGMDISTPFPRLTYAQAMDEYGSDKPDLRYDMKIIDVSERFDVAQDTRVKLLAIDVGRALTQDEQDTLLAGTEHVQLIINSDQRFHGTSIPASLLVTNETEYRFLGLQPARHSGGSTDLGRIRSKSIEILPCRQTATDIIFAFVTDFPLFTLSESRLTSTHHPFTAPAPSDVARLDTEPLSVRANHYDLVVNGIELGGGSVRIHDALMQKHILSDVLKLSSVKLSQFDHLLRVLQSGCPPHAGFALGFDRMMALLCDTPSIRDVIAFPKTASGADLLVASPSTIDSDTLREYHLSLDDGKR